MFYLNFRDFDCYFYFDLNFFSFFADPLQTSLITLKLNFLRIICTSEHFIFLNLPYSDDLLDSILQENFETQASKNNILRNCYLIYNKYVKVKNNNLVI